MNHLIILKRTDNPSKMHSYLADEKVDEMILGEDEIDLEYLDEVDNES